MPATATSDGEGHLTFWDPQPSGSPALRERALKLAIDYLQGQSKLNPAEVLSAAKTFERYLICGDRPRDFMPDNAMVSEIPSYIRDLQARIEVLEARGQRLPPVEHRRISDEELFASTGLPSSLKKK